MTFFYACAQKRNIVLQTMCFSNVNAIYQFLIYSMTVHETTRKCNNAVLFISHYLTKKMANIVIENLYFLFTLRLYI